MYSGIYNIPYTCMLYSKNTCYPWLQGESRFIEAALRELPTHTEQEIKAHSAWYAEYCTLLEAKKLAIQQWRKDKQVYLSPVHWAIQLKE